MIHVVYVDSTFVAASVAMYVSTFKPRRAEVFRKDGEWAG